MMFSAIINSASMNITCADGNVQEFLWATFGSGMAGSLVLLDNKLFPKVYYSSSYQQCESIPVPSSPYQYCQTL